jgi:hypothetical protein
LGALFKTIPGHSQVTILLESEYVAAKLFECEGMKPEHVDLVQNMSLPQRMEFLSTWKNKEIQGAYRKFDDDQESEFVRQRMIAIWEELEMM